MNKEEKFKNLLKELSNCQKCLSLKKKNGSNCSLINIYKNQEFCQAIPSMWTDWFHRLDAKIFVIGQDWGPYIDMQKLHTEYQKNPTEKHWQNLIDTEPSLTKKMLTKYLILSAKDYNIKIDETILNSLFITNAVMCARTGTTYRGNNIDLNKSTKNCSCFLKKQIEIVNPKIIVTLGYYPLLSLSEIYHFKIEKNLSKTIETSPIIALQDITIIPLYHPTAQIKGETQLKQYQRIWENL